MNKYLQKLENNKKKLEKLNTELSKKLQKVQLGLVDDIEGQVRNGRNRFEDAELIADELASALQDYTNLADKVAGLHDEARDIQTQLSDTEDIITDSIQAVEESARELGIDLDDIPALQDAENFLNDLASISEDLEDSMDQVPRGLI